MRPLPCVPRSTIRTELYTVIDSVLKDLKSYNRRVQANLLSFQVEMQVLKRLHYRGNNQHRTALFWRRIDEVRRYGRSLEAMDVYGYIELLRQSFWDYK